jgi:hypothetical protein
MWRWDQGRLTYFSLDKIRKIASAIIELDGVNLNSSSDPLRAVMPTAVGLPFKPDNYRIWRNYARVFKILGLASRVNNRMVATSLCKRLVEHGDNFLTYDEYIQYIAKTFYYPSPIFQGYNTTSQQSFPFCAIIKFLIAKSHSAGEPSINVETVFNTLIGNCITGTEPISNYQSLRMTTMQGSGDQIRQVREMLIFLSQLSYLSWIDGNLFIDMCALSNLSPQELEDMVTPIIRPRNNDQELEIQNICNIDGTEGITFDLKEPYNIDDITFTEGKKIRVTHLRTERNRKVVQYYFENTDNPRLCDVCSTEVADRYPWLNNLIEVHHILPLASPLYVDRDGTSMADLVGLCPNCHRATHAFYRSNLSEQNLIDFRDEEHAREVYSMVKSQYISIL